MVKMSRTNQLDLAQMFKNCLINQQLVYMEEYNVTPLTTEQFSHRAAEMIVERSSNGDYDIRSFYQEFIKLYHRLVNFHTYFSLRYETFLFKFPDETELELELELDSDELYYELFMGSAERVHQLENFPFDDSSVKETLLKAAKSTASTGELYQLLEQTMLQSRFFWTLKSNTYKHEFLEYFRVVKKMIQHCKRDLYELEMLEFLTVELNNLYILFRELFVHAAEETKI